MIAAQLLWRAWWRQAGAGLSALDGPAGPGAAVAGLALAGVAASDRRRRRPPVYSDGIRIHRIG
jgi:hypothetical protein